MLLVGLLGLLSLAPNARAEKSVVNTLGTFLRGENGGTFRGPRGIAVNETGNGGVAPGTFYVAERLNRRIQQFTPDGSFVRMWGWGVKDDQFEFETCSVAANCRRGIPGTFEQFGAGQLAEQPGHLPIAVDQATGWVYVADEGGAGRRVDIYTATGTFIGAFGWGVRHSSAEPAASELQYCTSITGCGPASFETGGQGGNFGEEVAGIAVAPSGKIYVADTSSKRVDVFTPVVTASTVADVKFTEAFGWDVKSDLNEEFEVCTEPLECKEGQASSEPGGFGSGSPTDIAIDAEENIYVLDSANDRIEKFSAAPTVLDATFGASAIASTFGAGMLQRIAVDRSQTPNHLLVAGAREAAAGRVGILELDGSGTQVELHGSALTITLAQGLAAAPASLGGNIYLSTEDSSTPEGGHRVLVLNDPPVMDPVMGAEGTKAEFEGSVVSNELETLYHFEYSTDRQNWVKVPVPDAVAGTQPGSISVSQMVTGLTGSQEYFTRLVANRPAGGGVEYSNVVTFTTEPAGPGIASRDASAVSSGSAVLNAMLNPQNEATTYHFEYGLQDCNLAACASLPSQVATGGGSRLVSSGVMNLRPNTEYHFRLVATNGTGTTVGPDRTFETRTPGTTLPDSRAYELVSPGSGGLFLSVFPAPLNDFNSPMLSSNGESAIYYSEGSLFPEAGGNGYREAYESVRGREGWVTRIVSPLGSDSRSPEAGGMSADHSVAVWTASGSGMLDSESTYLRRANGSFELVGRGSLGEEPRSEDPKANALWITEDADHIIFKTQGGSAVPLAPNAPAAGIAAIYDRTSDGTTHVVSLTRGSAGEDVTPSASATYLGSAEDGSAVAFRIGTGNWVRLHNSETKQITTGFIFFEGISEGGTQVFYVKSGTFFVFNTETGTSTAIGTGATPINVSDDGSHAYFASFAKLAPGSTAGLRNLYVWNGTSVKFIANLSNTDFEQFGGSFQTNLGRWSQALGSLGRGSDPSRTTPDGKVFVFQSHEVADYPYNSGGFSEIYRYDAETEGLTCISCSPLGAPAESEAELQPTGNTVTNAPSAPYSRVYNITDDGQAVFFNTSDGLLPEDVNAAKDVYEWKNGRLSLISTGRSSAASYLFSMTPDGHDVLFKTSETLLPEDRDGGEGSIYDARVGGGFPSPAPPDTPCLGEPCQGVPASQPSLPALGTMGVYGPGNLKPHHKRRHRKHRKRHKKHHREAKSGNGRKSTTGGAH